MKNMTTADSSESNGSKKYGTMPPNPQKLHGYGKKNGSCPKCGQKENFGHHVSLEQHIKHDHPNTRPGTYTCWICDYSFKKQGDYHKHHNTEHKNEKMACWVCGQKNWSTIAIMYGHIKRDHGNYKNSKVWKERRMMEGVAPIVVQEEEDSGSSLKIEGSYSVNPMFSGHSSLKIEGSYSVNPMFSGHFLAPALGWDVGEGGHLYDSAGESDHSSSYDAVDKDGAPIMQFNTSQVEEEEVVMLDDEEEEEEDVVEVEEGKGDRCQELSIEKCLNRGYGESSSALTITSLNRGYGDENSSAITITSPITKNDAQINGDVVEEVDDEDAILGI